MKDRSKTTTENINPDDLRSFLKSWKDSQDDISINEIAKRHKKYQLNEADKLIPSTISRFLNENKKPRQTTIEQIARVVLNDKNATTEQLKNKVDKFLEKNKDPDTPHQSSLIKIGTGWTIWSSIVTSLVARQDSLDNERSFEIPKDVQITLCDNDDEIPGPFWIKTPEDIGHLIEIRDDVKRKYIAENLQAKLDSEIIDAAFLLRPTFDSMKFHKIKPPLLVARIAVGHGTHLYCISKKNSGEKNINVSLDNVNQQIEAKNSLVDIINKNITVTVTIGNQTVEEHRQKLLSTLDIMSHFRELRKRISFEDKEAYKAEITELANYIREKNAVIMIIAFEPLNNIIFNHLQEELNQDNAEDNSKQDTLNYELKYSNFNLSKLVDDRSSYGLYASHDLVEDRSRFKILVDFLKAIDNYQKSFPTKERLENEIARFVGSMYYTPTNYEGMDDPNKLMKNSLKEISYSMQFLPFLEKFVELRG